MLSIDKNRYEVQVDGRKITLQPKEFDILAALYEAGGRVLSRAELKSVVWQKPHDIQSRGVDQHVSRLRRKIGRRFIRTVTTRGYSFEQDPR